MTIRGELLYLHGLVPVTPLCPLPRFNQRGEEGITDTLWQSPVPQLDHHRWSWGMGTKSSYWFNNFKVRANNASAGSSKLLTRILSSTGQHRRFQLASVLSFLPLFEQETVTERKTEVSQSRKYKQSQTLTTDLGLWGASAKQVVQKDNFKVPFFSKSPQVCWDT